MAEPQLYPTLSGSGNTLVNGIEIETQDLALMGQVAGLADDRVLAELFRLMPTDGTTVAKAIFPAGYFPSSGITPSIQANVPTVQPTGLGNASVTVNPFRAVVGSRNTPNVQPPGPTPGPAANWKDTRSAVFVNAITTLSQSVAFAANASGNPRWDLVYVVLAVDQPANGVQRRVKNASTSNVTVQGTVPPGPNLYQYLAQVASIGVVPGTPGASPALPTLPADSGGVYNVPLAYVRIPNGFTAFSTIAARDIREAAPIVPISRTTGAATLRGANGNNDGAGTYATNFGWAAGSAGTRPKVWLPPSMVGAEQLMAVFDLTSATETNWSHPPNSIVDSSVDWRSRHFVCFFQVNALASYTLATDPNHINFANPNATQRPPVGQVLCGNSFAQDNTYAASSATVFRLTSADYSAVIQSGADFGLYVDGTTGQLKLGANATSPQVQLWMWIMASAPYPNY